MKKVNFTFLALFILNFAYFAQTKQVAHKSHSGTEENYSADEYTDNFGLYEPYFPVEKVILTDKNCLVEVRSNKQSDTMCNHPYLTGQYTFTEIKAFYAEGVKFYGFENKFYNDSIPVKQQNPKNKKSKKSIYLIAFIVFLGGGTLIKLLSRKQMKKIQVQ